MTDTPAPAAFACYPMLLEPHYSERPWGGTKLADRLAKDVPAAGGPWGESWELSDHPDGRSRIANGPFAGELFGELMRRHPRQMCGIDRAPERYPLLIKYIDAAQDLSIQIHPDDRLAEKIGDRGKTECWFIMDCEPDTEMICGLAAHVEPAELRAAAESGAMEPLIRRVPLRPGDFVYLPAGTVHATLAGTLLCEVQQSSNATYRLWDWNRRPPRPLHVDQAVEVLEHVRPEAPLHFSTAEMQPGRLNRLVRNEFFDVCTGLWPRRSEQRLRMDNRHGLILNVVAGAGRLESPEGEPTELDLGRTYYLPPGLGDLLLHVGERELRLIVSESLELG